MKQLGSFVRLAIAAMVLLSLGGCNWFAKVSCKITGPGPDGCTAEGGVSGTMGVQNLVAAVRTAGGTGGTVDLSTLYIDTTGTTFSLPASGAISLVVKGSSGSTLGSNTFTYTHSGTQIVFQNRSAVETWLSNSGSATSLTYSLEAGASPYGAQTISNALYYQGQQQAAASQSFSNCPKGIHNSACPPDV